MTSPTLMPLYRQLARVSRRLFLQSLVDSLAWCWAGALVLAAVWLLVEPQVPGDRAEWVRWAVAGGIGLAATMLAVLLAVLRAPNKLVAALTLDERFGLKERVTTSLTLDLHTAGLPAGQALLADASERVAELDVGERFPLRMRWNAILVPLAGMALAAVVFFYEPTRSHATTNPGDEGKQPAANKEEMDKKVEEVKKKAREKKQGDKVKNEKMDLIDDELQKILNKPRDTKDDVRDRLKDLTALQEKAKKDQDDLKDRAQAMKDQMQQLNKNAGANAKDGPAKEMQKALEQGDFKKAQEELEKLRKKLEDKENPLNEKEQEQLKQQLQEMKDKLKQAADPEEAKKQLEQLKRDGKIDQEKFDKAMEQIKQNANKMSPDDQKKLNEIADALKQAEQALKDGDGSKAADALQQAGEALKKSDELMQMQEDLQEQLDELAEAQRALRDGMANQAGQGAGRRPEGDPHETGSFTSKLKGQFDPKGAKEVTGYVSGPSFKKKSSAEMANDIKQASQDAPEAMERQRIPRAANDMARGYFENFRKLTGDDEKKDK
jgi:uncharacterized coiled-coil DUF342 family protein